MKTKVTNIAAFSLLLFLLVFPGCANSSLQADYNALQQDYNALAADLAELEAKYPPVYFPTIIDLQAWLSTEINPPEAIDAKQLLQHACELQAAALEDGFVINVSITCDDAGYSVCCEAILENGDWYYWDPDSDDVQLKIDSENSPI